jgi:hypothetical protein
MYAHIHGKASKKPQLPKPNLSSDRHPLIAGWRKSNENGGFTLLKKLSFIANSILFRKDFKKLTKNKIFLILLTIDFYFRNFHAIIT